jgi:hypothetical protein
MASKKGHVIWFMLNQGGNGNGQSIKGYSKKGLQGQKAS